VVDGFDPPHMGWFVALGGFEKLGWTVPMSNCEPVTTDCFGVNNY
jgi:hypothetical protein